MMSIERSGVRTWIVPRTSSQYVAHARASVASVDRLAVRAGSSSRASRRVAASPSRTTTSVGAPLGELEAGLQRARTDRGRRRRRPAAAAAIQPGRAIGRAVAAEELGAVAVHAVCRPPRSRNATRPANSVFQGLRASSAPRLALQLGDDARRAGAARRAEHPFGVAP